MVYLRLCVWIKSIPIVAIMYGANIGLIAPLSPMEDYMSLRIGLAGYGRRGRGHIRAVNEIDGARIASVSDPVEAARANAVAEVERCHNLYNGC